MNGNYDVAQKRLYNPIKLFLEFYYMANGLSFEILDRSSIILRIFYPC